MHLRHGCASDSKVAFVLRAGAHGFDALPEIGCDPSGIAGAHGFDEINIAELSVVFYRLVENIREQAVGSETRIVRTIPANGDYFSGMGFVAVDDYGFPDGIGRAENRAGGALRQNDRSLRVVEPVDVARNDFRSEDVEHGAGYSV